LIKRYIKETGSEQVLALCDGYPQIGAAALTQAEMASALAKAVRLGWVDQPSGLTAWGDFLSHRPAFVRIPVTGAVIDRAASLAWSHSLRGHDAVQLACALTWKELSSEQVLFACFDENLSKAAWQEGLQVWTG
jgi:predicted nucleic acid-binding protein